LRNEHDTCIHEQVYTLPPRHSSLPTGTSNGQRSRTTTDERIAAAVAATSSDGKTTTTASDAASPTVTLHKQSQRLLATSGASSTPPTTTTTTAADGTQTPLLSASARNSRTAGESPGPQGAGSTVGQGLGAGLLRGKVHSTWAWFDNKYMKPLFGGSAYSAEDAARDRASGARIRTYSGT
jgi:hypothetical protein